MTKTSQKTKDLTPEQQADRLVALDLTLAQQMPPFTRAASSAQATDGAVVYLTHANKILDCMRDAIRRYDAGELQTYQEKAKDG